MCRAGISLRGVDILLVMVTNIHLMAILIAHKLLEPSHIKWWSLGSYCFNVIRKDPFTNSIHNQPHPHCIVASMQEQPIGQACNLILISFLNFTFSKLYFVKTIWWKHLKLGILL